MSAKKKANYDKEDIVLARYAKALSHPARILILRYVGSVKTCFFREISKIVPLAGSTVSQHLSELKTAGLIIAEYDPPNMKYSIDPDELKHARKLLKNFMK